MGDSNEKSRRGILALLGALCIGLVRFGEDILTNKHILSGLARNADEINETPSQTDDESAVLVNDSFTQDTDNSIVSVNESHNSDDTEINISNGEEISGPNSEDTLSLSPVFTFWNVDTEVTLESSEYFYWDFDFEEGSEVGDSPYVDYDIFIREGTAINFFILRREEFEAFEQNYRFRSHMGSETDVSTRTEGTTQLDRKKYYFVVENEPSLSETQEIRVSVEISFRDI